MTVKNLTLEEAIEHYKAAPNLENYVTLRRQHPDVEVVEPLTGDVETISNMHETIQDYGIEPIRIVNCLDGNSEAVSELSLQLLEKIVEAQCLKKSGETQLSGRGLVVPDRVINWLIAYMLENLCINEPALMPRDLVTLIVEQLGGAKFSFETTARVNHQRSNAKWIGGQLLARGKVVSIRKIAKIMEVEPSTVLRWFPNDSFDDEIEKMSRLFDENGDVIAFDKLKYRKTE